MRFQANCSDETFIPSLVQNILSEDMFFRVADDLSCLGVYDEVQCAFHVPTFTGEQELTFGLLWLLTELESKWESPVAGKALKWLYSPGAMETFMDSVGDTEFESISDRIRHCQNHVATTLNRFLAETVEARNVSRKIVDRYELCFYLRSDEAVNDLLNLDMTLNGLTKTMSEREFILFGLGWYIEVLRQQWQSKAVAASLCWICARQQEIVEAILASGFCSDGITSHPERAHFLGSFCAAVIERRAP